MKRLNSNDMCRPFIVQVVLLHLVLVRSGGNHLTYRTQIVVNWDRS